MRFGFWVFSLRAGFSAFFALGLVSIAPFALSQGLASSDISRLRSVGSVELSPDGHRIAYTIVMRDRPARPYGQLWMMDVGTQKSARVGGEKDAAGSPLWSPDGKSLAFQGSIEDRPFCRTRGWLRRRLPRIHERNQQPSSRYRQGMHLVA